jgi:hypothetical protein
MLILAGFEMMMMVVTGLTLHTTPISQRRFWIPKWNSPQSDWCLNNTNIKIAFLRETKQKITTVDLWEKQRDTAYTYQMLPPLNKK